MKIVQRRRVEQLFRQRFFLVLFFLVPMSIQEVSVSLSVVEGEFEFAVNCILTIVNIYYSGSVNSSSVLFPKASPFDEYLVLTME